MPKITPSVYIGSSQVARSCLSQGTARGQINPPESTANHLEVEPGAKASYFYFCCCTQPTLMAVTYMICTYSSGCSQLLRLRNKDEFGMTHNKDGALDNPT